MCLRAEAQDNRHFVSSCLTVRPRLAKIISNSQDMRIGSNNRGCRKPISSFYLVLGGEFAPERMFQRRLGYPFQFVPIGTAAAIWPRRIRRRQRGPPTQVLPRVLPADVL